MADPIAVRVTCGVSSTLLCFVEVLPSDSVSYLQDVIEQKEGTRASEQVLCVGRDALRHADTIGDAVRRIVALQRTRGLRDACEDDDDLVLECLDVRLFRGRVCPEESRGGHPPALGAPEVAARPGGSPGACEGPRRAARLEKLRAWAGGARVACRGAGRRTLAEGSRVRLADLRGPVHLNGCLGVVSAVDPEADRYSVRLEGPTARTVRIRSRNVKSLGIADVPGSSAGGGAALDEAPLAFAVRTGDLVQVQALLVEREDPDIHGTMGRPLLFDAADSGELSVVALLLGYGADPTPLLEERPGPPAADPFDRLVASVCELFLGRGPPTEEQLAVLESLDPGVLARVRKALRLSAEARPPGMAPAACLGARPVLELPPAEGHAVELHYADAVRPLLVLRPQRRSDALLVLLHGLHQSGPMLERLARELSWVLPGTVLLMPTAPALQTAAGLGPAWFDAFEGPKEMAAQLEATCAEVLDLIRQQWRECSVIPARTVLAGFSMGAMLAAWVALQAREGEGLAGLVLLSAIDIPEELRDALPLGEGFARLPVLQCHGSCDRQTQASEARGICDWLCSLDCSVQLVLHDGVGHTLSPSMLAEMQLWLSDRLA